MITKRRIAARLLGLGLGLFLLWIVLLLWPEGPHQGPRFTISKETTYLTEPLRPDGFVDYVAALNQRASQGVTPENNAVVLFWQAVGPKEIPPQYREEYFKLLGIPPLAETGDYLVPFDEFLAAHPLPALREEPPPAAKQQDSGAEDVERHGEEVPLSVLEQAIEQLEQARQRPWSKQDFPALADWLAANERPLAVILEASNRPRYYNPCLDKADHCLYRAGGAHMAVTTMVRALGSRAMLRLGEGPALDAWQDLLTLHRLARRVGQGPTLLDHFIAWSLEGGGDLTDESLLRHARLSAQEARRMRNDLAELAPLPPLADKLDLDERCMALDSAAFVSREGRYPFLKSDTILSVPPFLRPAAVRQVDWDHVLRTVNAWYDRIRVACGNPDRNERNEALTKINAELDSSGSGGAELGSVIFDLLLLQHRSLAERVGKSIISSLSMPVLTKIYEIDGHATMQFELTMLGFALAEYRAEHGSYPARLADLVPKYVPKVPLDLFNDEELHYQPKDDGYALWSVGLNGIDDGGKNEEDFRESESSESWDDPSIRVPGPTKP